MSAQKVNRRSPELSTAHRLRNGVVALEKALLPQIACNGRLPLTLQLGQANACPWSSNTGVSSPQKLHRCTDACGKSHRKQLGLTTAWAMCAATSLICDILWGW